MTPSRGGTRPSVRPGVPGTGVRPGAARPIRLASPPKIGHPSGMQRVFSGIQPSGIAHLGNYLGAIRNWVALQDSHECIYCVVDLHAVTENWPAPGELARNTREMAAVLLACGIDPGSTSCSTSPASVPTRSSPGSSIAWPASAG